jgi:hypothetical protein
MAISKGYNEKDLDFFVTGRGHAPSLRRESQGNLEQYDIEQNMIDPELKECSSRPDASCRVRTVAQSAAVT